MIHWYPELRASRNFRFRLQVSYYTAIYHLKERFALDTQKPTRQIMDTCGGLSGFVNQRPLVDPLRELHRRLIN